MPATPGTSAVAAITSAPETPSAASAAPRTVPPSEDELAVDVDDFLRDDAPRLLVALCRELVELAEQRGMRPDRVLEARPRQRERDGRVRGGDGRRRRPPEDDADLADD